MRVGCRSYDLNIIVVFSSIVKRIIILSFIFFFCSSIGMVVVYKFFPVYVTPLMVIRLFQQKSDGEKLKLHHHWISLDKISDNLPVAVVASEDQRFMYHHGFDIDQIQNAAIDRIEGKRKRGGSTISQQTAKNVFLWPNSSWIRKGFEAYFTVLIEAIWGKKRIMEVYLNSIEMGDGIYGAYAVAHRNFDTSAKNLTKGECATIAATLPNPLRFNSAHPSSYIIKRKYEIMRQMKNVKSSLLPILSRDE